MEFQIHPTAFLRGDITIPGDKSISHRSVMLGSIAEGITEVTGFLQGEDCHATVEAFKSMGVQIKESHSTLTIQGVGLHGLKAPNKIIDLGNSGTSMRLLSGILAGQKFDSQLTGDASLCKRPMMRVVEPLMRMGAVIETAAEGRPPLFIHGGKTLEGITYHLPIASAQVKSCLLLAGLYAKNQTTVIETGISRDHTERMLTGFGVSIEKNGSHLCVKSGQRLEATAITVPGDISSAAFFIVAASITPGSIIRLKNVGINATRIGCITILKQMGAKIYFENTTEVCKEPVTDIIIESAPLHGITIPVDQVPLAIDEFPVLFIAAAAAKGTTILTNAKELRVKESDRIRSMAIGLTQLGIKCEEQPDGITIQGGKFSGGEIESFHDHRIAMAFSVAGLIARDIIKIKSCDNVRTSFPNFHTLLAQLGGKIEVFS